MSKLKITEALELGRYAGSFENKQSPIHSWFVYHHSFGKTLVSKILSKLQLDTKARVLDPFCGCGTTLLVCQERGIESTGLDLMPLSILVSRAKTSHYTVFSLKEALEEIKSSWNTINSYPKPDIAIINKAFNQKAWDQIQSLRKAIEECKTPDTRDFFLTALLSIVPMFGAFSNDGGFPRLAERPRFLPDQLKPIFLDKVYKMTQDVQSYQLNGRVPVIMMWDAREKVDIDTGKFDAIICSPPYPNRHDYTRVYSVELATAFLQSNNELKELRRQLFRSHIEVIPTMEISVVDGIDRFQETLNELSYSRVDKRVPTMIKAYFQDVEKVLCNIGGVLKPHGKAAIVIGNVRFSGVMILVDEIIALIGREVGFNIKEIIVIRYRGNSPQQMRDFGKMKARESIIILQKEA